MNKGLHGCRAARAAILWLPTLVVAATLAVPAGAQEAPSAAARQGRDALDSVSAAFEAAAATVNPSVVPIFSQAKVPAKTLGGGDGGLDQLFGSGEGSDGLGELFGGNGLGRLFGGQPDQRGYGGSAQGQERKVNALGSGVIASSDGYILTNAHVVSGSVKLTVQLPDGKRAPARIVGADTETDLAVIKVDATGLPAASFGNSDRVKIGEWVIAVGNPFELLHTTTAGIVSATGRSNVGISDYEDFIQTDAAVNPGNSGGALADLDGKVIGINAAISSPSGGSVGLGFAIPINMAMHIMEQLKTNGRVVRGYLGAVLQQLTPDLQAALGIPTSAAGVLIGSVERDGPAAKAGLRQGDVVTQFDGSGVDDVGAMRNLVAGKAPNSQVRLGIVRDGAPMTLTATLGERPQPQQQQSRSEDEGSADPQPQRLGLVVETLSPELAQRLGYEGERGALVVRVMPGGVAEDAGLQRGDLIKKVDRQDVTSANELAQRVSGLDQGPAALLVQREEKTFFVAIDVP